MQVVWTHGGRADGAKEAKEREAATRAKGHRTGRQVAEEERQEAEEARRKAREVRQEGADQGQEDHQEVGRDHQAVVDREAVEVVEDHRDHRREQV